MLIELSLVALQQTLCVVVVATGLLFWGWLAEKIAQRAERTRKMSEPDSSGWWFGAAGFVSAFLTAAGAIFANKRKADSEDLAAKRKQEAESTAAADARADDAYREVIKALQADSISFRAEIKEVRTAQLECVEAHSACEAEQNALKIEQAALKAELQQVRERSRTIASSVSAVASRVTAVEDTIK